MLLDCIHVAGQAHMSVTAAPKELSGFWKSQSKEQILLFLPEQHSLEQNSDTWQPTLSASAVSGAVPLWLCLCAVTGGD